MIDRPLSLDDLLCFALYSANNAMGRLYRPLLARHGLTYPQYLVLVALWQRDGQKVTDLGVALNLESNTLTPLLKRMEQAGLVQRQRSQEDERSVIVTLAAKGRGLEKAAAEISRCILEAAGEDVAELIRLRDRIQTLTARLQTAQ
ncbi:MarR family winged helix-turn-helix transcriptional regulator [Pseudophaeobacter flagellatus]|uniref:MarR family winged helix-turn-helix transcriptional regulator n=1 Tax=Pseudophaeobacter flagellatus TaxID=2899119 RepID=UPI001E5CB708|nr:MarR family transcriptional regulator [Pseudophaeobacter flagellatus]MCD9147234.1 MarR family transcriptional regulator [Pseudophaeobacter flagellatus]